ncbi:MAG: glycosyltransferase [Anaerolineae bacterium]|nr:glycosyltransferase [Anaerolineae bacterium]
MINRIAMLSVHTSPLATLGGKETGGMNVYVRDLTQELSRRGLDVDVYTRSQNPATPRIQPLGERGRVIKVKAGPEEPYNKNLIFNHLAEFEAGVQAQAKTERIRYDIIYAHYWLSGLAANALRRAWDVPMAQMFHTLAEMKNRVAQTPAERDPDQRVNCEGEIMRFADRLIAATPLEKNQMTWLYGADAKKISIVPPGVDLARFKPMDPRLAREQVGVPSEDQMLLFVGRIQPLKGIDTLIRALALVKKREPALARKICVSIIGGDPNPDSEVEQVEFERLETLRAELGISDLVTFLGAKDQDTLVYYYAAAEMVVMPSHYESFGMVALEAMACGTPVIASDVGGLSFSIEDGYNGYRVPNRDPQALADKIILLLKHRVLRDQLGEQARMWVQHYSWVNIAEELLEVFEDTRHRFEHQKAGRFNV